ncbi:hypothetical protein [Maricaulis sp.]|uniref:hypothetical protein n=1 Tax=Maricaulis sp. TaxID=1486257 RepID=UPI003A8DBA62
MTPKRNHTPDSLAALAATLGLPADAARDARLAGWLAEDGDSVAPGPAAQQAGGAPLRTATGATSTDPGERFVIARDPDPEIGE